MPSGPYLVVALVIALAAIAVFHFERLCLRDLAGRRDDEINYLTRAGWAVVIACIIPLGGICYLYLGRPR